MLDLAAIWAIVFRVFPFIFIFGYILIRRELLGLRTNGQPPEGYINAFLIYGMVAGAIVIWSVVVIVVIANYLTAFKYGRQFREVTQLSLPRGKTAIKWLLIFEAVVWATVLFDYVFRL